MYNYDPVTRDARSCGTTASLCGVERALEQGDGAALKTAVRRDLLLHGAMMFIQGFPMLNSGDEIAQLNGWDYHDDPDLAEDSRNLHRSAFDWDKAALRGRPGTVQNAVWRGLADLRALRADPCFAPGTWFSTWDTHDDGVLGLIRRGENRTLVGLFNFTGERRHARLEAIRGAVHDLDGAPANVSDLWLHPYEQRVLVCER